MFHETWSSGMYEIVAAVIGATISGVILLQVHHSKVKQELEIHRKKDSFERKQKMYRSFVNHFMALMDLRGNPTQDFANWRVGNYLYHELLFVGDKFVINAFNKYLKYDKHDDIEFTNLTKDVLIEIRKDLYGEILNRDEINFIRPTRDADEALKIINQNNEKLKPLGLTNFKSFSEVDSKKLSSQTGINLDQLEFVKQTALKEIQIEFEFQKFLEKEFDFKR